MGPLFTSQTTFKVCSYHQHSCNIGSGILWQWLTHTSFIFFFFSCSVAPPPLFMHWHASVPHSSRVDFLCVSFACFLCHLAITNTALDFICPYERVQEWYRQMAVPWGQDDSNRPQNNCPWCIQLCLKLHDSLNGKHTLNIDANLLSHCHSGQLIAKKNKTKTSKWCIFYKHYCILHKHRTHVVDLFQRII